MFCQRWPAPLTSLNTAWRIQSAWAHHRGDTCHSNAGALERRAADYGLLACITHTHTHTHTRTQIHTNTCTKHTRNTPTHPQYTHAIHKWMQVSCKNRKEKTYWGHPSRFTPLQSPISAGRAFWRPFHLPIKPLYLDSESTQFHLLEKKSNRTEIKWVTVTLSYSYW